tara:strand:+ start:206 stop:397 length:192 start_codon:yes stop_codon:yes gene_type:complete
MIDKIMWTLLLAGFTIGFLGLASGPILELDTYETHWLSAAMMGVGFFLMMLVPPLVIFDIWRK